MTGKSKRWQRHQNVTVPDLFVQTAREKDLATHIQKDLREMIHTHYPNTDELVKAAEALGLPVITDGPKFQLRMAMLLVGAQDGFIAPTLPKYDEFVKTLLKLVPEKASMDFSTGLIIATEKMYHYSFLCYQLYHWMSYKSGMSGYDDRARRLYVLMNKRYDGYPDRKLLEKLDYDETLLLKTAIRRDREALQFLRRVLNEVFIPKNNGKFLHQGKALG